MSSYVTAYLITEEDIETLVKITTYTTEHFTTNLGWVLVVDYKSYYPKWFTMPQHIFHRNYPGIEFSKPVAPF